MYVVIGVTTFVGIAFLWFGVPLLYLARNSPIESRPSPDGVAIGGGLAWSVVAKTPWPVIATTLVVIGMHYSYSHALKRGINQTPPTTTSQGY